MEDFGIGVVFVVVAFLIFIGGMALGTDAKESSILKDVEIVGYTTIQNETYRIIPVDVKETITTVVEGE